MKKEEDDDINTKTIKVVLVGDSGVGKTCIISRFITNKFNNDEISTDYASFATKTLSFNDNKKKIKFDVWDTAGQEIYRSIGKIFYNDAKVVILVYDISNKKSFIEIKNYWYKTIKENVSNAKNKFLF